MVCAYRTVALDSFQNRGTAFAPLAITANLYRESIFSIPALVNRC